MSLPAFAVACSGLLFSSAILYLNRDDGSSQITVTHMPIEMMEQLDSNSTVEPVAPSSQPSRPVAPDIVAVPELETHTLERIEPRTSLQEVSQLPEKTVEPSSVQAQEPYKQTILHSPVALAAGIIETQGHKITFAEITPTDPQEQCTNNDNTWACGIYARTAFRNWLRGRALTCTVPEKPSQETIISECMLGNLNPAEWLVEYGWAKAKPGSALVALEDIAREERRGIFGASPSQALPPSNLTVPETQAEVQQETNIPILGNQ